MLILRRPLRWFALTFSLTVFTAAMAAAQTGTVTGLVTESGTLRTEQVRACLRSLRARLGHPWPIKWSALWRRYSCSG